MPQYKSRLFIATFIITFAFGILIARLSYLQIIKGEEFEKFSQENRIRLIRVPAPRGRIYDRNGVELVSNRASFDVTIYPNEIENIDIIAKKLSSILQKDYKKIKTQIDHGLRKNKYDPIKVATDIDREKLALIESQKSSLKGVSIEITYLRHYNLGNIASSIIGYVGKPDTKDLRHFKNINPKTFVGKSGVERAFEKELRGKDGIKYKVIDAFGREVKSDLFKRGIKDKKAKKGNDVYLSIDINLQKVVEEQLKNYSGAVVVMDVHTGEILAMASAPSFDPSLFIKGIDPQEWEKLTKDPKHPLLNRVTQGIYPPGSVFKMIPALAALKEGTIESDTRFYCPGYYKLGRKKFRCWKRGGHGMVDIKKAIVESCDVFFYIVGEKLGIDKIANYARSFGLGSKTGIVLPEKEGLVPSAKWKNKKLKTRWYKGETIVTAIGQGFLSVTPIQIAVMTSAIANGGKILKPLLANKIKNPEGEILKQYTLQIRRTLPFTPSQLGIVQESLIKAVNTPYGTGRKAQIKGFEVAGKTGTAQVTALKKKTDLHIHNDHAWFTSYFPANSPQIAVTVLVEHGGKGGSVAAPIAKEIIKKFIEINKNDRKTTR